MKYWRDSLRVGDGYCFFGVCSPLGADVLLGRNGDYKLANCYSVCRGDVGSLGLRGLLGF